MNVELISYTRNALELLLYTKDTRLQGKSGGLELIKKWTTEKKLHHLAYMKDTIQSSWEFVDFTFKIDGVSRAFTHQLVRTRQGSYAQESQRTVDVRDNEVLGPDNIVFTSTVDIIRDSYAKMIDAGVPVQDARAILPTGTTTSIIAKFDLRTLHNMALVRLCTRTQGEYQQVFKAMCDAVFKVYPWTRDFIKVSCAWDGICAFPRYTECPVQKFTIKPQRFELEAIQSAWENSNHVANPKAKDGVTM